LVRGLAPLSLTALALAVRLWPLFHFSFDGLYGQDAYAYYAYARTLYAALAALQAPPLFWWPLGYPGLLAAAFALDGVNIAAAQAVTLLAGALVAPCAYALTRALAAPPWREIAGWTAGLLCALGGQLLQSSVVIMADAPALLWATLAAWLLVRYARQRNLLTLALAAVTAGLAVWTRWQNLLFAGAWFAALGWIALHPDETKPRSLPAGGLTGLVVAATLFGAVLLPQLLLGAAAQAPLAGQSWLEGWSPVNFFARSFETIDGHFEYPLPPLLFYAQVLAHPAYLFLLLTPFCLVGGGILARQARREAAPAILILGWVLAMFLFLAGIPYENFRFMLGLYVPVAVLTGLGVGWVWTRWAHGWTRLLVAGSVAVSLLVALVWQPRVLAPVFEIKQREQEQVHWLTQNAPPDATIWTLGLSGTFEIYTSFHALELWQVSPHEIIATAPSYLFIDTQNLDTQWQGHSPDMLYHALLAAQALHPLGESRGWTLFLVTNHGN
jgi:hypothetical protein